jgi:phosphatidylglycerophosphate synthase
MKLLYGHLKYLSPSEEEAAICNKIISDSTGMVAKHINKRISLPISLLLARQGFKPNNITFFNMCVGLFSGLFACFGTPLMMALGGFLFQVASILDGVDGEVAKLTKSTTQWGQWLDTISDNLTLILFVTGLAFGLYRTTHSVMILAMAELSLISIVILIGIMLAYLKKNSDSGSLVTYDKEFVSKITAEEKGFLPLLIKYGRYLLKKDSFAMSFFLLCLFGFPEFVLYFTALATTLGWMLMLYYKFKRKLPSEKELANET